ncbi:Cold-regulated protein 27 [Cardamine amara subsp. amara]|uniref:Cold-regulated protein 27 n=1 Tax=Cardamine amara subsp. amara TaxID=228776 RepID=A0ABD1ABC1_CARAN
MVGDYRDNFIRHSSDDSDDSDDASSVEEETTSSMYSGGKEYMMDTEWTDEKHSLYLKSMEASFVDQLYNSLGALGNKENVPSTGFGSIRNSSQEQFKVLHDGFWQKINVKQPEYRGNGRLGGGSREFLKSPWIKHYKSLPKSQSPVMDGGSSEPENQVVSSSNGKKGIVICSSSSASSLKQMCSHSRDRDQISIGEEASDQNFVNEVTKGENGSSKKMKTVMNDESSSTDQVVPLRKTPTT